MRLAEKVSIVTGASSGIGKAIAQVFHREGTAVVVADVDAERGETVATEIKNDGGKALFVKTDVSEEADVISLIGQTVSTFGSLDIMVNNAGIIYQSVTVETSAEWWDKILKNNLRSCFLCCREAAKAMIKAGNGGKIVNISSIHATLSEPQACAYTAAKGGMEAFSRTLATEVAPYKINVNCIEPGATYTDLTIPMYTESVKKALYERIPLKEIAQPEWIANGAVYLASDESRYVTGQVLVIDGGYVMDGSLPGAQYWTE